MKAHGLIADIFIAGRPQGPLSGRRFVAKDLFDLSGHTTGAGNPDWLRTHEPAASTATAVTRLLGAGADLIGKSQTDELAFSIFGSNVHYGTPINPQYPDRVPGGSSSGSASLVAAKLVDFALGTDTGGSIRTPSSFCGIYGYRPTHGVIPVDGVIPLAPGFDTVGLLARRADLLRFCGEVLLGTEEIDGLSGKRVTDTILIASYRARRL